VKKWSLCGRVGVLAALTLTALAAANVAAADPGIGVASSVTAATAPVTQSAPSTPALPAPTVSVPTAPAAPAVPSVPAPVAAVVSAVPHVAVPKVAVPHVKVPHVAVGAKAKASVHLSRQHKITVKSSLTTHARVGKTHAKVSTSSKVQVSKNKVTATRVIAANSTGACAGFPMPPYNCSQIAFDTGAVNQCNHDAIVNLSGYFHDMANAQTNADGSVTIFHHINWENVKGAGDDGNLYTASDQTRDYEDDVPILPGVAVHIHLVHEERQNLVSLGSDPNQIMAVQTTVDMDIDPLAPNPPMPTITITGPTFKCTG
jgi:hypothetical protein